MLLRFEQSEPLQHPFGWDVDPDDGIPDDVASGYVPIARAYAQLLWSVDSYYKLNAYRPESLLEDESVQEFIDSLGDEQKADLLDDLYESNRRLWEFWEARQQQFESIKTTLNEYGGYAMRDDSVAQPLLTAGEDIESLAEDRVDRFEKHYQQLIERVQTNLDVNISVVGKQLSIVVFGLTVISVVVQIPTILAVSYWHWLLVAVGAIFVGVIALIR